MELNDVLYVVFALVIVIITRYLVPYLKVKLEAAGQESLVQLIEDLVEAAEQIFNGMKMGETKKEYVVDALHEKGIEMTENVNAIIESAVYRLNNKKEEVDVKC